MANTRTNWRLKSKGGRWTKRGPDDFFLSPTETLTGLVHSQMYFVFSPCSLAEWPDRVCVYVARFRNLQRVCVKRKWLVTLWRVFFVVRFMYKERKIAWNGLNGECSTKASMLEPLYYRHFDADRVEQRTTIRNTPCLRLYRSWEKNQIQKIYAHQFAIIILNMRKALVIFLVK